ncbi:mRNA-decapping enzyme 1B-like [Aplochiton taeniatus]
MAQRAGLQFQVISPQRIPATVAPTTLLLSPSVFSQSKPPPSQTNSCPPPSVLRAPLATEDTVALSRSQLQATLLHLIQTDSSFLDTIYESYISRLPQDKGSTKY